MKKILPYIFILIAFTGIYTINSTASAEDPKGTCTVRIMQTGEVKDWYDVTAQYCTDNTQPKNNTSLYERMNWEANRTCVAPLSLSQNNECVCQLPYGELRNGICVAPGTPQPSGSCTIQSAKFTPSGTQATSWYKDANPRKSVKIDVVGSAGCLDKEVEISIVEQDTLTPNDDIAQLDNRPIRFTNGTSFSINLNAGETGCELEGNPDCNYFIQIYKLSTPDFKSDGKSGGNLRYDCDGVCDENWLVGEIIKGPAPTPPTTETTSTTYTFLAPLPCERGTEGCNEEGELETFDPATSANAFGRYINLMIKLFIGICAVLAVVMIVMGGIEYMGSELISGKEAGKDRINGAVLGLLLALGAYTLLYTINPDLLDVSLSSVEDVRVEVDLEEDIPQTPGGSDGKTYKNSEYKKDTPWGENIGRIQNIPGVTKNFPECETVGQSRCLSTRNLNLSNIDNVKRACPGVPIGLNGGTEFWHHGGPSGNTTHGPGSPTVDIHASTALNTCLSGGRPLVRNTEYGPGGLYFYEVNHWHIGQR